METLDAKTREIDLQTSRNNKKLVVFSEEMNEVPV